MSPFDIFNPSTVLDPAYSGEAGATRLMQAATQFPGGATGLVFALFWMPAAPGIPAGVLLARGLRLAPAVTFGLYALSDVLAMLILNPVYSLLRAHGRRNATVRKIGQRLLALAMIGARRPSADEVRAGKSGPALFRIATVGFGVDIYTAGALATGLPIPRLRGWAAALAGDLAWFALLLGSSIAASTVFDETGVMVVVLAVSLLGPALARRIFPALRG